jgi:hypothetical protein
MRFLNMNDLQHLRRTKLAGMQRIGSGSFATVFAGAPDSGTVMKVTTDQMAYWYSADQLWLDVRSRVARHFPTLVEDFGEVGESRGASAYLVEMERLQPVSLTCHRRIIAKWIREWDKFRRESVLPRGRSDVLAGRATDFCQMKAESDDPYAPVFEELVYFFSNYGSTLDLKLSNFMERPSTGELVFNDIVFNYLDLERRSRVH